MTDAQRWGLVAGAAILGFLIGFGWQYTRAAGFSGDLDETRRDLAFHRLEATVAAAALEAQRGSHEVARQLASEFFTGLQQNLGDAPPRARDEFHTMLAQRDAIITTLSRGESAAGDLLARMASRFRGALRGPASTPPMSAPAGLPGG
jgi:hypothetical protein